MNLQVKNSGNKENGMQKVFSQLQMKLQLNFKKRLALLVVICFVGESVVMPLAYAQANRAPSVNGTVPDEGAVTLSFSNADIESVASVLAKATGQTILVDPKVKGTINLISNRPLTKAKAIDAFSTALRTSGFALVDVNGVYRVVPEADAKLISNSVTTGKSKQEGDQIITRVFKLNFESANNLLPVLRPLVSPNNTINAYPGNNTIVITDYASNIQRIGQLIESIDAPTSSDVQSIKLNYAIATDMATILSKVLDTASTGGADPSLKTMILAEPRSNSILVRGASAERIRQIGVLVARLDVPTANNGNIWVVPLKNAEAVKLAVTLRAIVAADASLSAQVGSTPGQPGAVNPAANLNQQTANQQASTAPGASGSSAATSALTSSSNPTTGGIIQAEPATNSIIITASEPLYRNLRHVIEQLDRRRTQVYIESLIAEVSSTNAEELGIQWQGLVGSGNQNVGFGGTNYTNAAGQAGSNIVGLGSNVNNILNPSGATNVVIPPAPGLNLGLLTKFNGTYGMSALITALATTQGTNILSTPNLITLDNEEARIVVGQNVPIITGSYAQTGSTSTVTPFQTYTRQDVGLTLRVRPQVSDNGIVKMQIYQEVSSIYNQNFASGIILNKRNIESNVLVDDGQIIVLGGLIEDKYNDGSNGVPFLKDIPIIGALFRSDAKTRTKTNLLVFMRPYILRDKDQAADITTNRLNLVQQTETAFKQAPMLLPKEDLTKMSDIEPPLIPPGKPVNQTPNNLPSSGLTKPIPVRPSNAPASAAPVPITIQ
ncbi:type II secretion system secretin GspD [Polynucleobacter sp. JS-JIR-II-c23]|uniref:type II secretion system secretin GspD n=1 Tax=Polynucleobacter sp. JS-JIR-II-c23 TaxID=1758393 RepID=UPI002B233E6B|nr:type II secretion system secretin GspD [Polynucleobacter sp. JS-JIR-II-c23]MEA9604618.1 type II secretion system secretin GspD [Polynucleobacter sp. JS-JIR-II-c23]